MAELNDVLALKQILECIVVILLNRIIVMTRSAYFERATCRIGCLLLFCTCWLLSSCVTYMLEYFCLSLEAQVRGLLKKCPLAFKDIATSCSHVQNSRMLWNVCCSGRAGSSGHVSCVGCCLGGSLCCTSAVFCYWSRNEILATRNCSSSCCVLFNDILRRAKIQ